MKDDISRVLLRYRRTFAQFSTGQKAVVVVGGVALLLAGFLVFRWASTPSYAPLYGDLSSTDASAVVDQLTSSGVPYKLTNGGQTIMVPQNQVYSARVQLAGKGLPSSSDSGYSLLDKQSLSTSQFQEQTNFKRAMEAELAKTIEAISGVRTAVVHLAIPEKQVFADQQDPPTASVLVGMQTGTEMTPEQVQSVVHLVASSIDGLTPENVTLADSTGRMLSTDGTTGDVAGGPNQEVTDYENELNGRLQKMLDRVVGAGNATVAVTANLDLDKAVRDTKTYTFDKKNAPLSSTVNNESFNGTGGSGLSGVVGPDGQMGSTSTSGGSPSSYKKHTETVDNAVGQVVEHRETTPGAVRNLHVGVVLDAAAARKLNLGEISNLVANSVGIDTKRGDTVQVSALPFDRTAETADAKAVAAADAAAKSAATHKMYRNISIVLALLFLAGLAWLRGRKRAQAREQATSYVVEQLRQEALERTAEPAPIEPPAAVLALESAEADENERVRRELEALVERQPEDVASLLRGWLVDH